MSVKSPSDLLNENTYIPPSLTLDHHRCLSHERKLGLTETHGSNTFSHKSQLNYSSTNSLQLLKGIMGGLDDDDDDDVSLRHQEDEWSRNQENEHSLPGSESNAKWMKEDQNQICKLAEQQQDQNLNLVENKNESTDRNPNQNSQRRHEEKNKTLKALCSDLHSWAADEPLLIYSSNALMEKNQENQEQTRDEEVEGEEDVNPSGGENTDSSEMQKKGGEGGSRNACLLFSKNGVPSDEDSSCMSLSQGSTASSTPDGEPGKVTQHGR